VQWGYTLSPTVSKNTFTEYYYYNGVLNSATNMPNLYSVGYYSNPQVTNLENVQSEIFVTMSYIINKTMKELKIDSF